MIFQEPMTALNPVLTAGFQVAEVLRIHKPISARAAWTRAVELLAEVGIPEPASRANDYPHQLSGGMRQRVMIAMAIACEPDLLIADEPTTALDVTIQAEILELLHGLRERRGMGVVLITHDLGVVAEQAHRVAIMYAGRIVEEAATAEEAIAKATELQPDLVLLDVNMPGMGGVEAAAALRTMLPQCHISLLTANVQAATRQRAEQIGVGFMEKPITAERIAQLIAPLEA
jgi:peptide/nickel transport system ATP-binding protein